MSLENVSLSELTLRREILHEIVRQAKIDGDPRIVEPQRQLKIIVKEINKKRGLSTPEDQNVGLDTLNLRARRL